MTYSIIMGYCYKLRCPKCTHEFEWREGSGKEFDVLHCDKCGKELLTTDRYLEYCNIKCECGGYYDKEVPVICPSCHKEIDRPRTYIIEATEWA